MESTPPSTGEITIGYPDAKIIIEIIEAVREFCKNHFFDCVENATEARTAYEKEFSDNMTEEQIEKNIKFYKKNPASAITYIYRYLITSLLQLADNHPGGIPKEKFEQTIFFSTMRMIAEAPTKIVESLDSDLLTSEIDITIAEFLKTMQKKIKEILIKNSSR